MRELRLQSKAGCCNRLITSLMSDSELEVLTIHDTLEPRASHVGHVSRKLPSDALKRSPLKLND